MYNNYGRNYGGNYDNPARTSSNGTTVGDIVAGVTPVFPHRPTRERRASMGATNQRPFVKVPNYYAKEYSDDEAVYSGDERRDNRTPSSHQRPFATHSPESQGQSKNREIIHLEKDRSVLHSNGVLNPDASSAWGSGSVKWRVRNNQGEYVEHRIDLDAIAGMALKQLTEQQNLQREDAKQRVRCEKLKAVEPWLLKEYFTFAGDKLISVQELQTDRMAVKAAKRILPYIDKGVPAENTTAMFIYLHKSNLKTIFEDIVGKDVVYEHRNFKETVDYVKEILAERAERRR